MNTTEKTILLCTIGSAGDVNPFIGIGQELKKRGFRVVLITSQYFESQAHSVGLEFFGLGSAEDYQSIIEDPDLWSPDKGFKVFAERVVFPIMEPAYEIIAGFDSSKTILVAQGQFFAAHIAHEKLGFPFITIHLQPAAFRSVHEFPLLPIKLPPLLIRGLFILIDALLLDKLFAPNINRFRQRLGLPAINKIFGGWMHSPQKNIGLFPDWFAQPQPDWPPQTQLTSFVYYDKQNRNEELPRELETFLKRRQCTHNLHSRHSHETCRSILSAIVSKPVNCLVSAASCLPNIPNNCPLNFQKVFNTLLIYLSAKCFCARWRLSIMAALAQLPRRLPQASRR